MNQPTLAYVETSLPAVSQAERLAAIQHWGIALEVANWGEVSVEEYQSARIPIAAVQAYQMHEFHPLHRDPQYRYQGLLHVRDTLELTAQLDTPRIVTVCGFGHACWMTHWSSRRTFLQQWQTELKLWGFVF